MELKSLTVLAELNRPPSEDRAAQHLADAEIAARLAKPNRMRRVRWALGEPLVRLGTRIQCPTPG
jgi:hypothetical protein